MLYCAWLETALLAKCEDRACQGAIAENSAILTDVEYIGRKLFDRYNDSAIDKPLKSESKGTETPDTDKIA